MLKRWAMVNSETTVRPTLASVPLRHSFVNPFTLDRAVNHPWKKSLRVIERTVKPITSFQSLDNSKIPNYRHKKARNWLRLQALLFINLVGMRGFEPPTPDTPWQCATGLRYIPKFALNRTVWHQLKYLLLKMLSSGVHLKWRRL